MKITRYKDCKFISQQDKDDIVNYLAGHKDATLFHSFGYLHIIDKIYGVESYYFVTYRDGVISGVMPLSLCPLFPFGQQLVTLPYSGAFNGIISNSNEDDREIIDCANKFADSISVSHIELREREGKISYENYIDLYANYNLDIRGGIENVWMKKLKAKTRNQVRKSKEHNLKWIIGGKEYFKDFYSIYTDTMHDLGSPVHDKSFFYELISRFPDQMKIVLVLHDDKPISTLWLIRFGDRVSNPWAGSLKKYRSFNPNNLAYWMSIEWAITEKCTDFDFGRSLQKSSHSAFKRQWGATEQILNYYHFLHKSISVPQISPNNQKLSWLIDLWKKMPKFIVNFIGPLLAKRVP